LVNPEVVWRSGETFDVWDSCFSVNASFFVKIPRYTMIRVRYQDEKGVKSTEEFSDDMSELLQHELDHLDAYHPLRTPDLGSGDPSAHPVLFLMLRQRVPEVTDNCGELIPKVGDPL
jgi:hypothetical protein